MAETSSSAIPAPSSQMPRLSRVARAALIIAVFFTLDKGLALFKSVLFNRVVGLEGMGVLGAANNIPDYLSALISGGALGIAFIPVLTETLTRQGRGAAWELFSRIVNLAFLVTAALAVLITLLAEPLVTYIIAPGFTPERQALTASLMRLDLVAIMVFSISGLAMAGLHANQHFLLPALAPGLYNLGQIFGALVLAPSEPISLGPLTLPAYGLGLYGIVWGVILGALLHLLVQVPGLLRYGFRWSPVIGLRNPAVVRVLTLMGPRVVNMAFLQVYFVARDSISSHFGEAAVGALNLGWFIQQVPETVIGTAIAIALLPSLAEFLTREQPGEFRGAVNRALRTMLALGLPIAAVLAVGVRPLVEQVFPNFDAAGVELVVWSARFFLLGMVGDAWLEVSVRSFYAQQRPRYPLIGAALQAVVFIPLAMLLTRAMGVPGVALAAALAFTAEALFLLVLLNRRFPGALSVGSTLLRSAPAALLAAGVTYAGLHFLPVGAFFASLAGIIAGLLVSVPFIWPEIRGLVRL